MDRKMKWSGEEKKGEELVVEEEALYLEMGSGARKYIYQAKREEREWGEDGEVKSKEEECDIEREEWIGGGGGKVKDYKGKTVTNIN